MRCLSLWQPWASLWLTWCKVHETRDWELHHRGWLLVHAAKNRKGVRDIEGEALKIIADGEFKPGWEDRLPFGAIIGAVHIDDVVATTVLLKRWGCPPGPVATEHWVDYQCGNYEPRRYAFKRAEDFRVFKAPIPYRGQQGPFNVPDSVVRAAFDAADCSVAPLEVVP